MPTRTVEDGGTAGMNSVADGRRYEIPVRLDPAKRATVGGPQRHGSGRAGGQTKGTPRKRDSGVVCGYLPPGIDPPG